MAERKPKPDISSENLDASPKIPKRPSSKPSAARKPPVVKPVPQVERPPSWEYLCVSFQFYIGWRPRFLNGQEIFNWSGGVELHDYINQLGAEGWELCAASAGESMHGSGDKRQLFFKRLKR
jgi:hypothetical protein